MELPGSLFLFFFELLISNVTTATASEGRRFGVFFLVAELIQLPYITRFTSYQTY